MNLELLTSEVIKVAKEVGLFIQEEATKFDREKIEHKGLNDLVSYVDKESEKKLIRRLNDLLPEAGVLAEEGTGNSSGQSYQWVIDPLDGTTNFTHGLPVYAISIALKCESEIIIGVVLELNQNECFSAWKGGGAWCNGKSIHVSNVPSLSGALLATGFPYYEFDQLSNYIEIITYFMKNTHGLRRMGSAAVDLCYVACGRFEGFFEYNLKPWDIMAGVLIVKEAGGTVSDFSGNKPDLSGWETLAAGDIHNEMQQVIESYWK